MHPISRQTKMAAETIASLAQLVEHSICNQAVVGSSPTRGSRRVRKIALTDVALRHKSAQLPPLSEKQTLRWFTFREKKGTLREKVNIDKMIIVTQNQKSKQ